VIAEGSGLVKPKLLANAMCYFQYVTLYILNTFIKADAEPPNSFPALAFVTQNSVETSESSVYTPYFLVQKTNKLLIKK
jgi:hypothetical protein